MKSELRIYTSFVSPLTLPQFTASDYLPIFIIRNIGNSVLIGKYSGTKIHCRELAPSTELFRLRRDKFITNEEYQKRYAKEIFEVDLEKIIKDWELLVECSGARGIILLGYGSDDSLCHRSTLRDILNSSGIFINRVEPFIL